jgi:hypothetical protein
VVTGEWAAGDPAARLVHQALTEAQQLDEHRRQLAAGNGELADLLLSIEEDALRQLYGQVQGGLTAAQAAMLVTPPPGVPGIRDRLKHGLGRLGPRSKQHGRRRDQAKTQPVVQGFVVPDEPATSGADATLADPGDGWEPS